MNELHLFVDNDVMRVTLRGVPDHPGVAAEVFSALGDLGLNVDLVVASGRSDQRADISVAVQDSHRIQVVAALKDLAPRIGAVDTIYDMEVALVGIAGPELARQPGVAGRVFRAISKKGINIELISTSLSSVLCLINRSWLEYAEEAIREEFGLAR
ncbi:MAG: ACT domain-containing protein [Candidatus Eisenbacteria bacterium]|nr:ACT domain-containing protein [Candidatus Eisenbacteria bacterium]MCC7143041.1 ACT domain-containing protein [Candidatus Eisenbacteria bacterium]